MGEDAGGEPLNDLLQVLATLGPMLHALLTRLTLHEDVAEDLLQDLFLRLSQAREFARADNPAGYAYRAAIRLAFDWRRTQRRRGGLHLAADLAAEQPSPLQVLADREELEQILEVAGQLPELQREVFILRHLQRESYASIARQLHKSPEQVRGLCHKALRQMRKMMAVDGEGMQVQRESD